MFGEKLVEADGGFGVMIRGRGGDGTRQGVITLALGHDEGPLLHVASHEGIKYLLLLG